MSCDFLVAVVGELEVTSRTLLCIKSVDVEKGARVDVASQNA